MNSDKRILPMTTYVSIGPNLNVLQYRHIMKHKLTVLICVIAIVSLGLYAKQIHDQYLTKENAAASVARSINLKAQQEAAKKQTQFLQGVSLDEQQCSKDKLAYYSLTAIVRAKTVAPDCVVDVN